MREAKRRGRSQSDRQEMRIEMKGGVKRTKEKKGFINFRKTCKLACVGMYSSPRTLWIIPTALYHLHHSVSVIICLSFFCLQTTAWLCPGTDGLLRGTATGSKKQKLTEHRYRAGFSSNAGVKHLTNFSTKPALFPSALAWT